MRLYSSHDPKTKLTSVATHGLSLFLSSRGWPESTLRSGAPHFPCPGIYFRQSASSLLHILLFSQTRMSIPRRMESHHTHLPFVGLALSTACRQCSWQKCTKTTENCTQPEESAAGIRMEPAATLVSHTTFASPILWFPKFDRGKTKMWTVGPRGRTGFLMALNETLALR